MRNKADWMWHICALPLLVGSMVIGSVGVEAQQMHAPPPPPHPDSTGVVVAAQYAAFMAAGMLMDGTLRGALAAEVAGDYHRLSRIGNALGRGETIAIGLAAVYGGSRVAGVDWISGPAGVTLGGLLVAGTANCLIKFTVGRARPGVATGQDSSFDPFSLEDRQQSFPSGHAVTAFALAAAISEQADRGWVTGASFGAAALVGWSRIHEDRHWTSDVVAGAIVGSVASRYTVRHLVARSERSGTVVSHGEGSGPFRGALLYPIPSGLAVMIPLP